MGRDQPTPEADPESASVKLGRYEVTCKRIRAEVWHLDGTHRLARYRQEWPDFWEAVDDMVALLDKDHPPFLLPPAMPSPSARASGVIEPRALRSSWRTAAQPLTGEEGGDVVET